ncbi:dienelactone hydrolase family protein [candidate division KSB1 bacterium]|nr:dienelactone hydrolase family protein [candidate division KSB1 bacterium]
MRSGKAKSGLKYYLGFSILGLILIGWVWFQIYLGADCREDFLKHKGTLVKSTTTFLDADSLLKNYAVKLVDSNGLEISCLVRTPRDSTRRYPALLVMNGFDEGKKVISLFRSSESVVLISFDYPYSGRRKFKGADIGPFLPHIRNSILRSVSVVLTVMDYLEQRPEVDPQKLFVVGASFGAPFAVNAAAIDPRIKAVILLYGGGDIAKMVEFSTTKGLKSVWARKFLGWFVAALLAPAEPLKYVEYISPRPLLMINGKNDESIFAECSQKLYDRARQPKEIIWLETPHAKPKKTDLTFQLERMMKRWLQEKKLL